MEKQVMYSLLPLAILFLVVTLYYLRKLSWPEEKLAVIACILFGALSCVFMCMILHTAPAYLIIVYAILYFFDFVVFHKKQAAN